MSEQREAGFEMGSPAPRPMMVLTPERGSKVLGARWMADRNRAPFHEHGHASGCLTCAEIRQAMILAGETRRNAGSPTDGLAMIQPREVSNRLGGIYCRDCVVHPYGCCARHADLEIQAYEAARMRVLGPRYADLERCERPCLTGAMPVELL